EDFSIDRILIPMELALLLLSFSAGASANN
ncbi:unnamed protein product, partial [marine sediment metagenome]